MMERAPPCSTSVRVLGIDPGTRVLGYGLLDAEKGGAPRLVDCGVVRLPSSPLSERLETIFREIRRVIVEHEPRVLAIEDVFHGKNFQSVLKVGEARGVVVLAAQLAELEIREYAPASIKKAATGNGGADKSQVQRMMTRLLNLETPPEPLDITDALAVAFCHCQRAWQPAREAPARRKTTIPGAQAARRASRQLPEGRRAATGRGKERAGDGAILESLMRGGAAKVRVVGKFRGTRPSDDDRGGAAQ